MSDKTHCLNCGSKLKRNTPICPQCGVAQPVRPIGGLIGLVVLLVLLGVSVLVAIV
ncbi:hypothetical protein [Roseovarius pacificus]|uniref:hypothetical protein n=1 Tax=Roseovarius pacificus TaxID=337701 RepID=UPI002A18CE39|nr:hypothetical protein [Roseovarius pacificus]